MTKIGFVGLGLIGAPMCKNLVAAGHHIKVWNRTASRMEPLVADGAQAAASAADASPGSEVTITCVSDFEDVEEVILGPYGIIQGAASDSIVIDMSTISPGVTRKIAAALQEQGSHMIDAPVSGGVTGAAAGTLSIMAGGVRAIFDRSLQVLEAMGTKITYCGLSGMGQVTKLANQITGLGTIAAMCEALVFAASNGADLDAVLRPWEAALPGHGWWKTLDPPSSRANSTPASW